ncbi:MAG: hypothetical protein KAG14_00645 [Mycoplasmataceae bacterium]|nr:hypothetical protein [Mycoplasmataceae bacterium]
MRKLYLTIGSLTVVTASTVAVMSCGTFYKTIKDNIADPNTHLLVEYLNAHHFTATQGEKTSETWHEKDSITLDKLNSIIHGPGIVLPSIFHNYKVSFTHMSHSNSEGDFWIELSRNGFSSIIQTIRITGFGETPIRTMDPSEIAMKKLLENFTTTNAKDLLTYKTIKSISDMLLEQIKAKLTDLYKEKIINLYIEKLVSDHVQISIDLKDNLNNNFSHSFNIAGFIHSNGTTVKRNAKLKVALEYLPQNQNDVVAPTTYYQMTIGGNLITYLKLNGMFVKNRDQPSAKELFNDINGIIKDIYKEIDKNILLPGDIVEQEVPLLAVGIKEITIRKTLLI